MIDLETMSTRPNAAIVSIGAVAFERAGPFLPQVDPRGFVGRAPGACFYANVDLQSCLDHGMVVDGNTVMWWLWQSQESRRALDENPTTLEHVLRSLSSWAQMHVEQQVGLDRTYRPLIPRIWSHGAAFDIPILQEAFQAVMPHEYEIPPWTFRAYRDTRTLFDMAETCGWEKSEQTVYVEHHALCDAYRQARHVQEATQYMLNLVAPVPSRITTKIVQP